MEDSLTGLVKKAIKGVNPCTPLEFKDFLDVLYDNKIVMRDQTRLRRHLKQFTVQMQREQKRALNSVYFKLKVSDDFITCSPHTDSNGDLL